MSFCGTLQPQFNDHSAICCIVKEEKRRMAVMLPSQSLGSGCRGPTSEANGFDTKPYFSQQLPPNFDNDYPRSFLRRYTAEMDNPLIHQQPTEQTSLPSGLTISPVELI